MLRVYKYCLFLFLGIAGFSASRVLSAGNQIPWEKCPKMKNTELVSVVIAKTPYKNPSPVCLSGKSLYMKTESGLKSELNPSDGWFKTLPINDADANIALRTFRDIELVLLDKVGTPSFYHKQGSNTGEKTFLLLLKRGKTEYRTEWKIKGRKLVLLLSGADLAIFVKLFWE